MDRDQKSADDLPTRLPRNDRKISQAVVAHLHKLEVKNQQLEKEKENLENQLNHILKRLQDVPQIINTSQKSDNVQLQHTGAPMARYERVGASDGSLFESNGLFSIPDYSSMSDVYEDICLNRDLVENINGSDFYKQFASEQLLKTEDSGSFSSLHVSQSSKIRTVRANIQDQPNSLPNSPLTDKYYWMLKSPWASWLPIEIASENELRNAMNQLYNLTTDNQSLDEKADRKLIIDDFKKNRTSIDHKSKIRVDEIRGPPKIQIMRKKIGQIDDFVEFSDSTSDSSLHLVAGHEKYFKHQLKKSFPVNDQWTKSNEKANPDLVLLNIPTYELGRKQIRNEQSQRLPFGSMNRFIKRLFFINPDNLLSKYRQFVSQSTSLSLFSLLAQSTRGLEVFTCISYQSYLIQVIKPSMDHLFPIFNCDQTKFGYYLSNIEVNSSDSLSQNSLHLNLVTSKLLADDSSIKYGSGIPKSNLYEAKSRLDFDQTHIEQDLIDNPIKYQDFIFKLNNHLKIWNQYWCVLMNQSLFLHQARKSKSIHLLKTTISLSDIVRIRHVKPHGSAPVERKFGSARSKRNPVLEHFELVLKSGKSVQLRGTNYESTQLWLVRLKQTMRMLEANKLFVQYKSQLTQQGWLKRIKGVQSNWLWCCLVGSYLIYFAHPSSLYPIGFRCLNNDRLQIRTVCLSQSQSTHLNSQQTSIIPQVLTASSDSDSILLNSPNNTSNKFIQLLASNHETVNLVCATQQEFDQWHESLTKACVPTGDLTVDSFISLDLFEKVWARLVRPRYSNSFYHTCRTLAEPLSKTIQPEHYDLALQMFDHLIFLSHPQFEWIHSTTPVSISSLFGTDVWFNIKHFILSWICKLGLQYPPLKDELYLQLVRQLIFANMESIKPTPKDAFVLIISDRSIDSNTRNGISGSMGESLSSTGRRALSNLLSCTKIAETSQDYSYLTSTSQLKNGRLTIGKNYQDTGYRLDPLKSFLNNLSNKCITLPVSMKPSKPFVRMIEQGWSSIAMWQFLALLLSVMLPSDPVLCVLKHLLRFGRHADTSANDHLSSNFIYQQEVNRYTAYCLESLEKIQNTSDGGRNQPPSVFEIVAISLRNPYIYDYPFSLPVYLPFGSGYEVIGFHGSSIINDLLDQIVHKLGFASIRLEKYASFGLYLCLNDKFNLPVHFNQIYLNLNWNVCDVISVYEQAIISNQSSSIKIDQLQIKLMFKIHILDWRSVRHLLRYDEIQMSFLKFLVHQFHTSVLNLDYHVPMSHSDFIELVAHLCRVDHVEYSQMQAKSETTLSEALQSYLPSQWLTNEMTGLFIQLKFNILDRWTKLNQINFPCFDSHKNFGVQIGANERHDFELVRTIHACLAYLTYLRNLCPARFQTSGFLAFVKNLPNLDETQLVWLVPQEERLNILLMTDPQCRSTQDSQTRPKLTVFKTIPYHVFISYGAQKLNVFFIVYMEFGKTGPTNIPKQTSDLSYLSSNSSQLTIFDSTNYLHPNQSSIQHGDQICMKTRKLKIQLLNIHHLIEFTSSLNFLINSKKVS